MNPTLYVLGAALLLSLAVNAYAARRLHLSGVLRAREGTLVIAGNKALDAERDRSAGYLALLREATAENRAWGERYSRLREQGYTEQVAYEPRPTFAVGDAGYEEDAERQRMKDLGRGE